ncbi:ScbA/BarX family gamma-butyrolactone biosynthesis protein [Streptomyces sp. NPDC093221]|uniref:ScbA/BarX family gamma-butyrolactone biosynthesis protein n=1 Tax=unclassified Streptomyces TaxID=2593676 RepID=UPI0037FD772E
MNSPTGVGGRARPLTWSRTVPRETVHRASVAEVLLTDVRPTADDAFEAAAAWPRSHTTFPLDGTDRHSPLVLVETLRQLGIYIPLRWYGVPPTSHLLITDLSFDLRPGRAPRAGHGCTEVTCRIAVGGRRQGADGVTTGLRLDVTYLADGRAFAQANGGARFLSAHGYAALRAERLTARQPTPTADGRPAPAALAVAHLRDVLITHRGGTVEIDPADPCHPFFFDHPTDHVPGMVLLEAARQAAAEVSGGVLLHPTCGRLVAARFAEFTPRASVECVPHHRTCVFRIHNGAERAAFGVLGYGDSGDYAEDSLDYVGLTSIT